MSDTLGGKRVNVRVQYGDPVASQMIGQSTWQRPWAMLGEDLSEGGVRLSSPEMLAVDTRLLLSTEPEPWVKPIRAIGKVRWVAQTGSPNRWDVGVTFTELSDVAAQRMRELVASRQGSLDAAAVREVSNCACELPSSPASWPTSC